MNNLCQYYNSSVGRKQIVATTGLLLILFIIGHLAGNLLLLMGPEIYNSYAKKLVSLRPGLYVVEFGLAVIFLVHIYVTALLVLENIQARPVNYQQTRAKGERSFATRIMPYTGTILFAFVVYHLLDFTFIDKYGPRSYIAGESYGLYGVVFNAFTDPVHSVLYIIAMGSLGFHLSHGVHSFAQTFGFNDPRYTPAVHTVSNLFGVLVAVGYSAIPVYVLMVSS